MSVAEILNDKGGDVVTIDQSATLVEAARLLGEHGIGAVVVMDKSTDAVAGILSERDIVRRIGGAGDKALDSTVSDCMTKAVTSCTRDATIDDAMAQMTEGRFRHLPVLENGSLVGIVSIGDVVKRKIDTSERDREELRRYIAG